MFEKSEFSPRFGQDSADSDEEEAQETAGEEIDDQIGHYIGKLEGFKAKEDNEDYEDLVSDIKDQLEQARSYFEASGKPGDWQEFWKKMDQITSYLAFGDVEGAEGVWVDAELELKSLKKNATH